MAVLQQHVCCVHLCAEEREAAVVGEVEVAVAVAEEVGVVCSWHRQCRGTVGCLTGGGGVEVVGEEEVVAALHSHVHPLLRCGERRQ